MLDKTRLVTELQARVNLIENPSILGFVMKMLNHVPSAFWERPASTRHHMLDERGAYGNILHTIRVIDLSLIIADVCDASQARKDVQTAGAALHDTCRHGPFGRSEHSRKDHPSLVRKLAEKHGLTCDHYTEIMRIIENHMGRWGDPPFNPNIGLDETLHLADSINARFMEVL